MQFRTSPDALVYVGSAILFLLPFSLLYFAARRFVQTKTSMPHPTWRRYVVIGALGVAGLATVLNVAWNASWLRSGGSPHGMGAGPGIWQPLGPVLVWSFLARNDIELFSAREE